MSQLTVCLEASDLQPLVDVRAYGLQQLEPSGPVSIFREALILKPGTYNGFTFTAQDCRDYAENYNPADPPPIVLDHNIGDANKSYGHVRALRFDEPTQELRGLTEFLGSHAVERVTDKRWKKLSGRFIISKAPERRRMTELSVTLKPAFEEAALLSRENARQEPSFKPWFDFEASLDRQLAGAPEALLSSTASATYTTNRGTFLAALEGKKRIQEAWPRFMGAYVGLPEEPPVTLSQWTDQRRAQLAHHQHQAQLFDIMLKTVKGA